MQELNEPYHIIAKSGTPEKYARWVKEGVNAVFEQFGFKARIDIHYHPLPFYKDTPLDPQSAADIKDLHFPPESNRMTAVIWRQQMPVYDTNGRYVDDWWGAGSGGRGILMTTFEFEKTENTIARRGFIGLIAHEMSRQSGAMNAPHMVPHKSLIRVCPKDHNCASWGFTEMYQAVAIGDKTLNGNAFCPDCAPYIQRYYGQFVRK